MSVTLTVFAQLFDACLYYFFMVVVVVRYETTATARWALLFIVRAFFNDTITVAVWTGFHVRLMGMLSQLRDYISAGASLIRLLRRSSRMDFDASNSLK